MTSAGRSEHPLATLVTDSASGRYPVPDGGWRQLPPWRGDLQAMVAFTGHAVLVLRDPVPDDRLLAWGVDGYGGAHHPRVISALAGADGWVDSLDALLVTRTIGPGARPPLVPRPDLARHPRVAFASRLRDDLQVLGYRDLGRRDVAIVARGLAGLTELSVELELPRRGSGAGVALVRDALATIPQGRIVVAAVAPGNAASLRTFLSAGFGPVGSIQLFRAHGPAGGSR